MECKVLAFCIVSVFLPQYLCIEQASFYGNSYIYIPFKEAKSSTDIYFKFRTQLTNSLILLVAGTTDYCIVELENGKLKVNINLGAGEFELLSPSSAKLNDFKWHDVVIGRREANLSMTIDKTHKVQKHLPGKFFELNIHYGLFVGDHRYKNNTDIFFGHVEKYRGCLAELVYNDIHVLQQARHRQSNTVVQGITWNCAAEFEASTDKPISFVEDDSYMAIAHKTNSKEIKLSMELRTVVNEAMLYYNPSYIMTSDYFLISINNKTINSAIKIGDKRVDLNSRASIADGKWHKVTLRVRTGQIELTVDEHTITEPNTHGLVFKLSDSSYLGGLEIRCLRNIVLNDAKIGLPDAQITDGLLPGCVWNYPCLQAPCNNDAVCVQQGLDSFKCECGEEFCVKPNYTDGYKVFSKNHLATDLEILAIEPLDVLEGQSQIITVNNLHIVLDYQKYGIKETGIVFTIVDGPQHGSVTQDVWTDAKNSFTLSDVARDKIHYVHDGSEETHDSVAFQVDFATDDTFILPVYLQGGFHFRLSANIVPTNDPPVLDLADTSALRIVQGTKKLITSDILKAIDLDNVPSQIIYNIVKSDNGYFENANKAGTPIKTFTQEEIDNEMIYYVERSQNMNRTDAYISLTVSDGIETSKLYKMRVSITPQYWRLENNTGLIVLHQTWSILTPLNLSFTSNVPHTDYRAQFYIVKKPNYGLVEIEKSINDWQVTDQFSSNELKQHRVRYRHTSGKPEIDEFQFQTTLDKSAVYTFRLTFARCTLSNSVLKEFHLHGAWEAAITTDFLLYETKPMKPLTSINYVLAMPPKYGYLFSSVSKYKLRSCDTFTQEDIILKNIKYRLYQKGYARIADDFAFVVLSPGCNNITNNFTVKYSPAKEDESKVQVNIKQIKLDEGATTVINNNHLYFNVDFITDLIFNVTQQPDYGMLQVKRNGSIKNDSNYFTLSELKKGLLYYSHDGSETVADSFTFMALAANGESFEYVSQVNVTILLKNDNSPVRVVDRVFNIVVGGERLLTGNDLRYVDDDLGTPTSDIIYTCRESTNGNFYNVNNQHVKVTEFTQYDLDSKLILFKHKGPEYGKVRLWVTDGQFHVNGVLEIQASAPFIHATMDTKVIVEQNKVVVLTRQHLSYVTNLFASDSDVFYAITSRPSFGKVVYSKTLHNVANFTQSDVDRGLVSYLNEASSSNADEIGIRIRCKDAVNVGQLGVWILPSIYWEPLNVKTNKLLSVEESTSALITRKILDIQQPNVPPSAINYHINEMPMFGYITILSDKTVNEPSNVYSFTQDMINDNKVLYIQSGTNQTTDKIIFNVTNGIVWLTNLQVNIEIIPERFYLKASNLVLNEGDFGTLTANILAVQTQYYKSKVTSYTIKRDVKYGCVQVYKRCLKTKSFTHKELFGNVVRYAHDGSENLLDEFVIVAEAGQKSSVPVVLTVTMQPVNDQQPKLVNNTGMTMWEGGVGLITNEMLASTDDDMPQEVLKYQVQNCWWGIVTLTTNSSTALSHFTQEQVDKRLVVFRHHNGTEARFKFNVTDGTHTTTDYLFLIKTKPVHMKLFNRPLHIFPLQRKYLTFNNLLTQISDNDRTVHYEVVVPPALGRLMIESDDSSGIYKVVSSFTQHDLNSSHIFYEHTHQFSDLYANDSILFNVNAHLTPPLKDQLLKIDISVSSGGLDAYVNVPKIIVDEGGLTNVPLNLSGVVFFLENHASLRSPIIHASANRPQHGQVFLKNNFNLTMFTQQQLESGLVYYEHDHSDSLSDYIVFSLYLIPGYIILCNVTVPVAVNPINDQPFNLVTPAPSLTVVQGENHTISRDELCTEDIDTPADKLKYDLISSPSYGKLVLLPEAIPITYFTQSDIDDNRLVYLHDGNGLKDAFQFRVWDGKFRPQFTLFNVIVIPINLTITPGLPVYLQQGSDVVFLTEKQFFIETNANKYKTKYTIKKQPKHGVLYVKDNPMMSFTQTDLRDENVMYLQTDMTTANDSFSVLGEINSGNTTYTQNVDVFIKVQALMQIHNFTVLSGNVNKITLHVLDATPLAKLTNSNPRYKVVQLPQYTEIRKIIRSSGEKRNVLDTIVNSFTHDEIQSGLIYLYVKDIEVPWMGLYDRIIFMLAASIFQPAISELKIHVKSPLHNDLYSTLAGPSDPAGHEGGLHLASPNMTRDYLLIVSMVTGVVILGVAVIVIIKCRSLEVEELNKEEQCLQPIPLPRPPDRLMTSSPPLKQSVDAYTPPTLPQCKVTPLNRVEIDTHSCYPYGVEEHTDDWSSCDASDPPCPSKNIMLRRNQYWV